MSNFCFALGCFLFFQVHKYVVRKCQVGYSSLVSNVFHTCTVSFVNNLDIVCRNMENSIHIKLRGVNEEFCGYYSLLNV